VAASEEAAATPTPEEALAEEVTAEAEIDGAEPEAAVPGEDVESAEDALTEDALTEAAEAEAGAAGIDYQDKYLRAVAELENVRKRARRDAALAETRGIAKLARELLPAIDNFALALAHAEAEEADSEHHLTRGIRLVQQELLAALERVGIQPESPEGERFDPHRHEAVAQQPVEGTEPGLVVQVYQPGYRYGDEILRPAKVVVSG
jgi:molecular chaperone GrpE